MAKPNASPKYNSQKVPGQRVRPNTAHPSNRNQHYQSEKIPGGRPSFPANDQGEFERPHELHRPNDQKRPSDFPRNQIDDEE